MLACKLIFATHECTSTIICFACTFYTITCGTELMDTNITILIINQFFCRNKPKEKCHTYMANQRNSTRSTDDPAASVKSGKSTSQEEKTSKERVAEPTQSQPCQQPPHASQRSQPQNQPSSGVEQESSKISGKYIYTMSCVSV